MSYRWLIRAADFGTSASNYGNLVTIPLSNRLPIGRTITAIRILACAIPLIPYNIISDNQSITVALESAPTTEYTINLEVGYYTGSQLMDEIANELTNALSGGPYYITITQDSKTFRTTITMTDGASTPIAFRIYSTESAYAPSPLRLLGFAYDGWGDKNVLDLNTVSITSDNQKMFLTHSGVSIEYDVPIGTYTVKTLANDFTEYFNNYYDIRTIGFVELTADSAIVKIKINQTLVTFSINNSYGNLQEMVDDLMVKANAAFDGVSGFENYEMDIKFNAPKYGVTIKIMDKSTYNELIFDISTPTPTGYSQKSIMEYMGFSSDGSNDEYTDQYSYTSPSSYFIPHPLIIEYKTDGSYGAIFKMTSNTGVDISFTLVVYYTATSTAMLDYFGFVDSDYSLIVPNDRKYLFGSSKYESAESTKLLRSKNYTGATSYTSEGPLNSFKDRMLTITCDEIAGINTSIDDLSGKPWNNGPIVTLPIPTGSGIAEVLDYSFPEDTKWVNITAKQPLTELNFRLTRDYYKEFGPSMIDWSFILEVR